MTSKLLEGVIWGVTAMDGEMRQRIADLKIYRENLLSLADNMEANIRQITMLADENTKDIGKMNLLLEELKK